MSSGEVVRWANPFTAMLTAFHWTLFFGRRPELRKLLAGITSASPTSFSVSGARTIGKTTLLNYLKDKHGAQEELDIYMAPEYRSRGGQAERQLLFVYIDFHEKGGQDVLDSLAAQLRIAEKSGEGSAEKQAVAPTRSHPGVGRDGSPSDTLAYLRDAIDQLNDRNTRVVFLLDDFDTALKELNDETEKVLRSLQSLASFIVVTDEPIFEIREDLKDTSPFLGLLMHVNIELLANDAAQSLVTEPTEELRRTQPQDAQPPSIVFKKEVADFLIEVAGRQPFLLAVACEALFDMCVAEPKVAEHLQDNHPQKRLRRQLIRQLLYLPTVRITLEWFWNALKDAEPALVTQLAHGVQPDLESDAAEPAIAALTNKALIYLDLAKGEYHLFSELFAEFIKLQRQPPSLAPVRMPSLDLESVRKALGSQDQRVFDYLRNNAGSVCSFEQIYEAGWHREDFDKESDKSKLDAAIYRIRQALDRAGVSGKDCIRNARGTGFRFVLPAPPGGSDRRSA